MPTDELRHFRWLYTIAHALHEQQGSPRAILKTTLLLTKQAVQSERGCIVTFEADGALKDAYMPDQNDPNSDSDNELWQRLSDLIQNGRRTVTVGDLSVDQPWPRRDNHPAAALTGSAVAVPLLRDSRLLAVLMLRHPTPLFFDSDSVELLKKIAETAAVALENAERFELLADSQALYRRLYKDASFPIVITGLRGDIVDVNPKALTLLGFDRQALLGLPLAAVLSIGRDPLDAANLHSAASGDELELSAKARTSSGQLLDVRLFARRVRLDSADYLVWAAQDMTAQVEQETHRRDLAAMIYHDLRGPLHNINLGLTRLDRLLVDSAPRVTELLRLSLGSTRQLTRMVNSLLDLEQLETGHAELDRKPVEVAELIARAAEAIGMLSEEAGHQLELRVHAGLPLLTVDFDMMVRVIINLLENAIKYTPDSGHVLVQADQTGDEISIVVSDSGPGIPADMREQIFDKYVRVKDSRAQSGLGLGLAFCRLAVQAHGGRIWVEDNTPHGARFIVMLPLETQSASQPA